MTTAEEYGESRGLGGDELEQFVSLVDLIRSANTAFNNLPSAYHSYPRKLQDIARDYFSSLYY